MLLIFIKICIRDKAMSGSKCKKELKRCNGDLSLALADECNNFKCQNKKSLYLSALAECRGGNCIEYNQLVGNNNRYIRVYALNSMTPVDEKQMIAQAFREAGHEKFALEVSRSISGSIDSSDMSNVVILENSLRFQGAILNSMNRVSEADFILSTADHINSLANKPRL